MKWAPTSVRDLAAKRAGQLFRLTRWLVTAAAVLAISLSALSYWALAVSLSGSGVYIYDARFIVHFPLEWASNEYSADQPFPIDTDSLFGVVTYWLPEDGSVHATWHAEYHGSWFLWNEAWWRYWLHPLDTGTDGEFTETGARALPISAIVYATVLPCVLMWRPWKRRRPGHCACGYDLEGLSAAAVCPECGKR